MSAPIRGSRWEGNLSIPSKDVHRVEVEWVDSTVIGGAWRLIEDIVSEYTDAPKCLSVGFLIGDDDKSVILAASVHGNEATGITIVPKTAIVRRKRLR